MKILKILFLSIRNLINFALHKTILLIIIIFGLVISTIGILFYCGNFLYNYNASAELKEKTLEISFNSNTNINEINNIIGVIKDSSLPNASRIVAAEKKFDNINITSSSSSEQPKLAIIGEDDIKSPNYIINGRYFNNNDLDNVAIASDMTLAVQQIQKPLGHIIQANNKTYKIIGVRGYSDLDNGIIIPLKSYINSEKTQYLKCEYSEKLNSKQRGFISKSLISFNNINKIKLPENLNPFTSRLFVFNFIQVMIIFTIALINIFTLLYYWIKSNKRLYSVYALLGCKRSATNSIIMLNSMIITVFSLVLGYIVFKALNPILVKLELISNSYLYVDVIIASVFISIAVIISFIMVVKFNSNNELYKVRGE